MGKLSHAEFRSLFEEKLEETEDAGLSIADSPDTLKRKCLSKLPRDFRRAVLSQLRPWTVRTHSLAARALGGKLPRRPKRRWSTVRVRKLQPRR